MAIITRTEGSYSVRIPSLNVGTEYLIQLWSKSKIKPTPIMGLYLGFGRSLNSLESRIPKLNTILDSRNLYFMVDGKVMSFPIKSKVACYDDNGIMRRITVYYDSDYNRGEPHLSKSDIKRNKIVSNAEKNLDKHTQEFKDSKLSENKPKESIKKFIIDNSKIDEDYLNNVYEPIIDNVDVKFILRSGYSKEYFLMYEYFQYNEFISKYYKSRMTKKINLSKYLGISMYKLNQLIDTHKNMNKITEFMNNAEESKLILIDNNNQDISNQIEFKMVLFWISCCTSTSTIKLIMNDYQQYDQIKMKIN